MDARNPLHGVITDQQLAELRERNHYRQQAAIAEMGAKWILHPAQYAQRKAERRVLRRYQVRIGG